MLEAPLFSAAGARSASFALPQPFFDGTVNEPVLHQAVTTYLNNQRQGTAAVKSRSFVSGGNQKPWKQKGTGRARQGTTRAPHWRGGGVAFGPIPRDYRTAIPAKVRQLARRSALNARAREGSLMVVEGLAFDAPKTAQLADLLEKLGAAGRKALVLTHGVNRMVYLSGRNLPAARVLPYSDVTAYEVLWADVVVVERGALAGGEATAAAETTAPKAPKAPARAARAKAPKTAAAKAPAKARKPAAKKKERE
jgi:large subunit ribosomal protein L4